MNKLKKPRTCYQCIRRPKRIQLPENYWAMAVKGCSEALGGRTPIGRQRAGVQRGHSLYGGRAREGNDAGAHATWVGAARRARPYVLRRVNDCCSVARIRSDSRGC